MTKPICVGDDLDILRRDAQQHASTVSQAIDGLACHGLQISRLQIEAQPSEAKLTEREEIRREE